MKACITVLVVAVLAGISQRAIADPLPGEILKFQQLPLTGGPSVVDPYVGPYINTNGLPIPSAATVGAPFPGHDELSTAYSNAANPNVFTNGQFMADDFADMFTSPVVHVRWWGSYLNQTSATPVHSFLISFETDVPATTGSGSFSHPGTPILSQIVNSGALAPASGTFTETVVPGVVTPDGPLYQYNAELRIPYNEPPTSPPNPAGDPVTWLKIVALADPTQSNLLWGWHDRDWSIPDPLALTPPTLAPGERDEAAGTGFPLSVWHFQDDAVGGSVTVTPQSDPFSPAWVNQSGYTPKNYIDGIDGPTGIGQFSKDLAFELYTVPEPASASLLAMGAAALAAMYRRRHRIG
jgi:hypothetical protein